MCVKEFLGYNCGHCSIPFLRQCPLTDSNPSFPPCKFPAERPIFTNENCHACSRVLWNKKVLEEEARHRASHEQNLCSCEVVFDAEERGRRMRPRGGKGKGKMKEIALDEYHGHDMSSAAATGNGMARGRNTTDNLAQAGQSNYTMSGEPDHPRQGDCDARLAAYDYVGYVFPGTNRLGSALEHVGKGHGFPEGGFVRQDQLWEGQLRIGQPGSGMKWHPEQGPPTLPLLPALPPIPSSITAAEIISRIWQRATSEPGESRIGSSTKKTGAELEELIETLELEDVEGTDTAVSKQPGPVVVSSDMAKPVLQ